MVLSVKNGGSSKCMSHWNRAQVIARPLQSGCSPRYSECPPAGHTRSVSESFIHFHTISLNAGSLLPRACVGLRRSQFIGFVLSTIIDCCAPQKPVALRAPAHAGKPVTGSCSPAVTERLRCCKR